MNPDEDYKKSAFNEAGFQMRRLDREQSTINLTRTNPQFINELYGVHNYILWVSAIDSLFAEVSSKLTEDEYKKGQKVRAIIKSILRTDPPLKEKLIVSRGNAKRKKVWDNKAWERLERLMDIYEALVRKYMEGHGLGSPLEDMEQSLF